MMDSSSQSTPPNCSRLPNFNAHDEVLLCMAYVKFSIDGAMGTNQPGSTLWEKITNEYNSSEGVIYKRSENTLQGKFRKINTDCVLYTANLSKAYGRGKESGTSEVSWVITINIYLFYIYN